MKILLSIKPEFVEKIFNGTKRYEYRKSMFKKKGVQTVVVYSTQPCGRIVGEFDIECVICDAPKQLWIDTSEESGIDESFFLNYFEGRKQAMAIKIGEYRLYKEPINPSVMFHPFIAPQSFRYICEDGSLEL